MKTARLFLLSCLCLSSMLYGQDNDAALMNEQMDLLYVNESVVENDTLQRLNLVMPVGLEKAPLLIWIGGGAWAYVDRHREMDLARKIASEGIAVASLGHRLSPAVWIDSSKTNGVQHPAHIQDVAAAFKWLYDHADRYGYDRDRIFIGGYSSGAHLAALLSMAETYVKEVGLTLGHIKGVIPIAGAYDISEYHRVFQEGSRPHLAEQHVQAVFGETEEDFLEASPTTYVESMSVPMLLISETQSFNYTRILEERIYEADFPDLTVLHVRSMGHGDFWTHLSQADSSKYRDRIVKFIKS